MVRRIRSRARIGVGAGLALILIAAEAAAAQRDPQEVRAAILDACRAAVRAESEVAAEEACREALRLADGLSADERRPSGAQLTWAHSRLSDALVAQGRFLDALRQLRSGARDAVGVDPSNAAMLPLAEASALRDLGLLVQAGLAYERARELVDRADPAAPTYNWGVAYNVPVGQVRYLAAQGRFRDALRELDRFEATTYWPAAEARHSSERYGSNLQTVRTLRGALLAELAEEEPRAEARTLLEAVLDAEHTRDADAVVARTTLARLHLASGETAPARGHLASLASIESPIPKHREVALAALRVLAAEPADRDRAFEEMLASLDALTEVLLDNPLPGGAATFRYRQVGLALEVVLDTLTGDELLGRLVHIQSAGRLWDALGRPTPSVAEVRGALVGEETGCLVFVSGREHSFFVAFDGGERVDVFRLARWDRWRPRWQELEGWLSSPPDGLSSPLRKRRDRKISELSAGLARDLFPPQLAARLRAWDRLVLVGRDTASGLLFELLPVVDDEPLGCTHAVVDLPSLPVGVALARRAAGGRAEVLSLADPALAPAVRDEYGFDERLGLNEEHLREVWGAGADLVLGPAARPEALAAKAASVDLVHVLAHGVSDPYRELQPMLALAPDRGSPDGLLTVPMVRRLDSAPTVFLAACAASGAPVRPGDAGANHLGGAFLEAGARTVVLSSYDVRLHAALEASRHFAEAWSSGADAAEALRRARCAMRSDEAFSDAHDWASLIAFGL